MTQEKTTFKIGDKVWETGVPEKTLTVQWVGYDRQGDTRFGCDNGILYYLGNLRPAVVSGRPERPEFSIGDKARRLGFREEPREVKWVGTFVLGLDNGQTMNLSEAIKVVTYPERWWNIYPDSAGSGHRTLKEAEKGRSRSDAIGILHLRSDGTAEMLAP